MTGGPSQNYNDASLNRWRPHPRIALLIRVTVAAPRAASKTACQRAQGGASDLRGQDMQGCNLRGETLVGDYRGAGLKGADLRGATLSH